VLLVHGLGSTAVKARPDVHGAERLAGDKQDARRVERENPRRCGGQHHNCGLSAYGGMRTEVQPSLSSET